MIFRSVVLFFLLHLLPKAWLIKSLGKALGLGEFRYSPEFSGRASLVKLATCAKQLTDKRVALVPDYICNVVLAALERAGFATQTYPTDDRFEPLAVELLRAIHTSEAGILVVAPLFGASGALAWLARSEVRDELLARGVYVIVDLCQDITLVDRLPPSYGDSLGAVLSFNDKSFLGIMGGGTLTTNPPVEKNPPLSLGQRYRLYRMLWKKVTERVILRGSRFVRRRPAGSPPPDSFEYSYCAAFPYELTCYQPSKLQLILGLIGRRNLRDHRKRKETLLAVVPELGKTPFAATAPYLRCDHFLASPALRGRRLKGSYAVHGHPTVSTRPQVVFVHNKGFCDD